MRRLVCLAALVTGLAPAAPVVAEAPVRVYAHRGGAALAPENTLGAFRDAHARFLDRGIAGWIELDAQLTADGELVVIHDDDLDRTTTCEGTVISKTVEELAPCDASAVFPGWGGFEPVPLLRDVLTEGDTSGWRLLVELKNIPTEANFEPAGIDAATALAALLSETGFPLERIVVQAFWPPTLDAVKALVPDVETMFLTTSRLPGAPQGVGFTLTQNSVFSTARGYEISAPDAGGVDAGGVERAHALGREVVVWTVNDRATIDALVGAGVDGIITDRPDLF